MPKVLTSSPAGFGYPLLPPDGGQAPVRGSNQDPAQEPAPAPQAPRAEAETAAPAASARPAEPGAESQKQDTTKRDSGRDKGANREDRGDKGGNLQSELSAQEQTVVRRLQARDREVRAHEQAHVAAGGQHAGGASYSYETGPDGKRYAVGGEVPIDTSEEATPGATIQKARIVRKAALAPAKPSATDRQVASKATAMEQKARQELQEEKREQAELAAQDQAQQQSIADLSSEAPSRLPQAPPYEVRMNPISKTV